MNLKWLDFVLSICLFGLNDRNGKLVRTFFSGRRLNRKKSMLHMFQQFGIEPENTERPTNVYVRNSITIQPNQTKWNGTYRNKAHTNNTVGHLVNKSIDFPVAILIIISPSIYMLHLYSFCTAQCVRCVRAYVFSDWMSNLAFFSLALSLSLVRHVSISTIQKGTNMATTQQAAVKMRISSHYCWPDERMLYGCGYNNDGKSPNIRFFNKSIYL